jgi:BlaI family transcriptional regulator, penicillinase repressor
LQPPTKLFVIILARHAEVGFLCSTKLFVINSMKKNLPKPTVKELEILQILWKNGLSSVKDVHHALGGNTANGYTTILKLLQIMHEKGLVSRQKSGKYHLYKASGSQETTKQQLVHKMIDTVFQGSASQLVLSALGNRLSSREDLDEIRKYLKSMEGGQS